MPGHPGQGPFRRDAGLDPLVFLLRLRTRLGDDGLQTVVAETRSEAQEKYHRIKACIPPEGALAWMSGHFGLDFSTYPPDAIVQNIEVPGIQGLFESIIYAKGGAPVTVAEAAMIYAQGMGMPVAVGTAQDIAMELEVTAPAVMPVTCAGGASVLPPPEIAA